MKGERFFTILSNMTKGSATTCYKRNVLTGAYGKPIEFNPTIKINAKAYIYEK